MHIAKKRVGMYYYMLTKQGVIVTATKQVYKLTIKIKLYMFKGGASGAKWNKYNDNIKK